MGDCKVIPFRKRRPSAAELAAYQQMTRRWHPEMRQLIFPDHTRHEPPPKKR